MNPTTTAVTVTEAAEASITTPEQPTLNSTHRCDRCDAQAWVHVFMPSGNDLLFCNHHYRKNETALKKEADSIVDETGFLVVNRLKGSVNS